MPFVTVQIAKGHSVDKKRELAKVIYRRFSSNNGNKTRMGNTVHINEFERENWAVGGQLHIDKNVGRHIEKGV